MKATIILLRTAFVLFAALGASKSFAADDCKDVLVNAAMNKLEVTKDNYYNVSLLSTADQKKDDQKTSDVEAGIDIEGIPFSLSKNDASRVKSSLSTYYSLNYIAKERSSYLLMSGQEVIIAAWRDCMRNHGGGLSVRFQPLDDKIGKQTLLLIEYYKPSDPAMKAPNLKLTTDVYVDWSTVDVKDGSGCLKAGKIFKPGDSCTVLLVTKSAWTTLPIVMLVKTVDDVPDAASNIAYSAYLGPRAEVIGVTRPWPLKGSNTTKGTHAFKDTILSPVECFEASEGFVLLENNIKIVRKPKGAATLNTCYPEKTGDKEFTFDPSGKRVCVQQVNGTPSKGDHYCSLEIKGTEVSVKWDPAPPTDTKAPAP